MKIFISSLISGMETTRAPHAKPWKRFGMNPSWRRILARGHPHLR